MNIFNVLSQGKSRLHEPSISAMLGYLLDPNQDHGLRDTFLRSFLKISEKILNEDEALTEILDHEFINASVELEAPYEHQGKRNDIDILLTIFDQGNENEIHRILIENKIKVGSANPEQLSDYYDAVRNDLNLNFKKDEKPDLTIIFLTPKSLNSTLKLEYENLKQRILDDHRCLWLHWSNSDGQESIVDLIKEILKQELISEINPINEYMKHTLKAFVRHIESVTSVYEGELKMRTGQDIGNIVEEVEILTQDGKRHRIVRRDSYQIQMFDVETGEKEIVRHIMEQYIDEKGMSIPYEQMNTRMLGKKLLSEIRST